MVNSKQIEQEKKELRRTIEQLRTSLTMEERQEKSSIICENVIEQAWARTPKKMSTLFTYIPFQSEVDITPLIQWCWTHDVRVVAPRVVKGTQQMSLHVIHAYEDVLQGAWGIYEPRSSLPKLQDIAAIDVIIVPGIAFDCRGGRMGYGGGFYDRFMELYKQENIQPPETLAVAFDVQIVDHIPMDEHDFFVDRIVTESRSLKCS